MDRLISKAEAANRLSLSVRTIDQMRTDGELPSTKVRGSVRIPESAIVAIIDSATATAATSQGGAS